MSAAGRRCLRHDDLEVQVVLRASSSILEESVHGCRVAERQNNLAVRARQGMWGGGEKRLYRRKQYPTVNPGKIKSRSNGARWFQQFESKTTLSGIAECAARAAACPVSRTWCSVLGDQVETRSIPWQDCLLSMSLVLLSRSS